MSYYVIANSERVVHVMVADEAHLPHIVSSLQGDVREYSFFADGTLGVDVPMEGYVRVGDEWVPPSPFPSWELKGTVWEAPKKRPTVDKDYTSWMWDEDKGDWVSTGKGIPKEIDPADVPEVGA